MIRRRVGFVAGIFSIGISILSGILSPVGVVVGAAPFSTTAVIEPQTVSIGQEARIVTSVTNNGTAISDAIVDIEVHDRDGRKVFQYFLEGQYLPGGETKSFPIFFTPKTQEPYTVKVGIFAAWWSWNHFWNNDVVTFTPQPLAAPTPVTPTVSLLQAVSVPLPAPSATAPVAPIVPESALANVSVWWPTPQVVVQGVQPLKALVDGRDVNTYRMYWQVDQGQLNPMDTDYQDAPHKETLIDVTGWQWRGAGPYVLRFVATDQAGKLLAERELSIYTSQLSSGADSSTQPVSPSVLSSTQPAASAPPPVVSPAVPTVTAPVVTTQSAPVPGTDIRMTIDTNKQTHSISPYIYGTNFIGDSFNWDGASRNLTLARFGGNRLTTYNWENNASNAGSDWQQQSDGYLGGGDTPGAAVTERIRSAQNSNAATLVTIPMQGYVARDKRGDGDVGNTANYLTNRFVETVAQKSGPLSRQPNTGDNAVYQDEFVSLIESSFPAARTDNAKKIFYSLDNEPDLWHDTHPRIQREAATYQGLVDRSISFARAIKRVAPQSDVFGAVSYGFNGFESLQNAPDANGRNFLNFYLDEMRKAEAREGRRLVDVLDVHWYPEAQGGGRRIIADDADPAIAEARIQAPRSLWDPTYVENSWIAQGYLGQKAIALLPSLKQKINTYYPGTKLAVTEYYYGGGNHISGAIAQADVLGVFGRENVYAANLWHLGNTDHRFIYGGFAMYRNFDGQNSTFGNTSIAATTDNVRNSSVYAAIDTQKGGRITAVLINKATTAQTADITVSGGTAVRQAAFYQLTQDSPTPRSAGTKSVTDGRLQYAMPPLSVTTVVFTP